MAISQTQLMKMHQASAFPFDDGLPSLLLGEEKACSFGTLEIAMYRPGELLRKCVEEASKLELSGFEAASDVSTTADELEADVPTEVECQSLTSDKVLPSAGSANHGLGLCRPCGFLYKGGCSEGVKCTFCHICLPGSIELERKMKRKFVKAVKQVNQCLC